MKIAKGKSKCKICKKHKDIKDFHRRKSGEVRGNCISCGKESRRAYRLVRDGMVSVKRKCNYGVIKDGKRICAKCFENKSLDQFWMRKNNRFYPYCFSCRNEPKILCMKAYGNSKCQCCKENILAFLTLDHIENSRVELGHSNRTPWDIYKELVAHNFPYKDKIRVLCMNCNLAVRDGRICPHVLIKKGLNPCAYS